MKKWNHVTSLLVWLAGLVVGGMIVPGAQGQNDVPYTDTFFLEECKLHPRGVNDYYIPLKPGCFLLLEGEEEDDEGALVEISVLIEVLPGKKVVDGVKCAILRETESEDGELVEISWNYFSICKKCKAIYYFGEDVDDYEDGEVVGHSGAWLAGENGNRAGLIMPGCPLIGSRYFQEVAPGIAQDRAEHLDNTAEVETPAGTFQNSLVVAETSPLDPDELSLKAYARGIGLIHDDVIRLVDYGCAGADDKSDDDDSDDK